MDFLQAEIRIINLENNMEVIRKIIEKKFGDDINNLLLSNNLENLNIEENNGKKTKPKKQKEE